MDCNSAGQESEALAVGVPQWEWATFFFLCNTTLYLLWMECSIQQLSLIKTRVRGVLSLTLMRSLSFSLSLNSLLCFSLAPLVGAYSWRQRSHPETPQEKCIFCVCVIGSCQPNLPE